MGQLHALLFILKRALCMYFTSRYIVELNNNTVTIFYNVLSNEQYDLILPYILVLKKSEIWL